MKQLRLNVANVAMEHHIGRQVKLARMAGLSENAMVRYWNGTVERPDLKILSRIAAALGCNPIELFTVIEVDSLDDESDEQIAA